ncbi:hypothetical protein [Aeoliella mucimassa]|uniref:Methyl-accepting chemotaxis protein (MCP) signaling domain protein n=1 Tax=Aeoliella mucimassa TaxID=2527972 RepID=A0A518AHK7_9BACT|nr:hypothetical protein [Aeoliella mucimassa]QDU54216.1 Methyl-accepting chemotaxis protein (MCP) signaling domain protein [Aeoliella mucimassa]
MNGTLPGIESALVLEPLHVALENEPRDLTFRFQDATTEATTALNTVLDGWMQDVDWVDTRTGRLEVCTVELASNANQIASETQLICQEVTSVATASEELNTNMASIAASAEQMSVNTKTLAAAAEEMSVSIIEVAKNSDRSAHDAESASTRAKEANETMRELGEAALGIGKVVEAIKDIAE